MKRAIVFLVSVLAGVSIFGDSACSQSLGSNPSTERLAVTVTAGPPSSAAARIPLSFTVPDSYTVGVKALHEDGTLDTTFNGYVRLSAQPGSVQAVTGPNTDGRNVLLVNGVANDVTVALLAAYDNTNIWAEDVGYVPADPERICTTAPCPSWCTLGKPCPPACANGIDDNHNGLIDYPTDPGCYLANDDSENGGTYTAGISPTLYYYIPRIADVNGGPEGGTSGTPFPSEAVNIDCGYRGDSGYAFDVIVTRVSSSGFYVTDLGENSLSTGGFGSVFAYNFDAPPNMRQCDRLRTFGGTTSDFYGFTEVNYPTWELEEWNPVTRPCGIPEPHTLAQSCTVGTTTLPDCVTLPLTGSNSSAMLSVAAALVRTATTASPPTAANPAGILGGLVQVSSLFGPGHPAAPAYAPTADATDCDLNNDGKVDRTTGSLELTCANACATDPQCSEYSNYLSENQFNLVIEGVTGWTPSTTTPGTYTPVGTVVDIQADGSTDALFNPVLLKGQLIGAFTGTLYYFSGGAQFTIQARCADDIVVPVGGTLIPSDTACVHARTILDTSEGSN